MPEILCASPGGIAPVSGANLINDRINIQISVEPGKTCLVRIINVGKYAGQAVYFEDHPFTAVEVEGVWVNASYIGDKSIRITTGQRWSFLIHTKNLTSQRFAIYTTLDVNTIHAPPATIPTRRLG